MHILSILKEQKLYLEKKSYRIRKNMLNLDISVALAKIFLLENWNPWNPISELCEAKSEGENNVKEIVGK